MKRALLTAGIVSAVGLAGAAGVSSVYAATTATGPTDPMSSLVDKIAERFSLNKSDVQQVFDENRQAMQAEREQRIKDELNQLVTDGKLTQDQVDKINAKRTELKAKRDEARSSGQSASDRRTAMQAERTELAQWADDNDIPTEYLRYVFGGHGGHHGPGGMGGMHEDADATPSDAPSTN